MNTELIPRTTLTQMCAAYRQSEAELKSAFQLLVESEKRLKDIFGQNFYGFDLSLDRYRRYMFDKPEGVMEEIKKQCWRVLVDRMELRRVLSVKRAEELDRQLESGEGLPEIEETQILAMLEGTLNNVGIYIEEAVKEVFEYLRPERSRYKTNSEFEVGKRVILTWTVERKWGGGGFRPIYQREQRLRAVDNVFHALDGRGTVKTNRGQLVDAIDASPDGKGETDYFKFSCHNNRNIHMEFKRLDLLAKLNAVAGGMRLKPENNTQQ